MKYISTTTRVTMGLVSLSISVWLLAMTLGLLPDPDKAVIRGRVQLSEHVAADCSLMASRNDVRTIDTSLRSLVARNPQVESAAVRRSDGALLVSVGDHVARWSLPPGALSSRSEMRVPIMAGESEWGTVELKFQPLAAETMAFWQHPLVALFGFVISLSYLMYLLYLQRMLRHLDPSKVIPERVRSTLDTLAEGLLVLDKDERIVMANRAFADNLGTSVGELLGKTASKLPWEADNATQIAGYPWSRVISSGTPQVGDILALGEEANQRVFKVNAAPILADNGQHRGVLTSFDDVTTLERNRTELRQMLAALSNSRDEIRRQNTELERLATCDPLTSCFNRRALFDQLETFWSAAGRHGHALACLMVDLDHFKSINDTHGHSAGDFVLEKTAELLRAGCRTSDIVCRYGGEEFCILLPYTEMDDACAVAEKLRRSVEATHYNDLKVTASIGVSARSLGAEQPQQMIDQADQCLYVAKRRGRNQVIRFDQVDENDLHPQHAPVEAPASVDDAPEATRQRRIPFHAVTALLSALAYRDAATADHSRRVADLCVATAKGLMSVTESYVLEIAALLHDIGKIGVPDSILLKPGRLSEDEWKLMNVYERIGVEIVQSTFDSPELAEIVGTYRAWYGGTPQRPELPTGETIPLGSRILAIADAFNSMTSHRRYRKPMTSQAAFAELRRCAGKQFDGELVERFIAATAAAEQHVADADAALPQAALFGFGYQVERLAESLERQDSQGMAALARRLNMTAAKYEQTEIAALAARLADAADSDAGVEQLVELTHELLDLCRAAQRACLGHRRDESQSTPTERCEN